MLAMNMLLPLLSYAYTIGRHPSIKDGLGFQKETKNLTSQRTFSLNKGKGKAPMAISSKKNHAYLYDKRITSISHHDRCNNHAFSHVCHNVHLVIMPCLHLALHMLMVGIDLGAIMLLLMRLGRH
jgi:hypothetical protein